MKTLEIKGTKLKLTKISGWRQGDTTIFLDTELKKNLRYQEIVFMSLTTTPRKSEILPVSGKSGLIEVEEKLGKHEEAWVLEKMMSKSGKTDDYDNDEEKLINTYCAAIVKLHVPVVESLLQSTQNINILQSFYESYGNIGLARLRTQLLFDYPKKRGMKSSAVSQYSPIYQMFCSKNEFFLELSFFFFTFAANN